MNARGSIYPIHPHNKHNVSIAELKTGRVQVSNDAAVARQRARDAEAEAARTAGTALTAAHVPELGLVGLRTLRVHCLKSHGLRDLHGVGVGSARAAGLRGLVVRGLLFRWRHF